MTPTENKKLTDAALLLKEHCSKNLNCKDCLFFKKDLLCALHTLPKSYRISKPSRWTARDIELAKVLKEFGFTHICRGLSLNSGPIASKNGEDLFNCPKESFYSLTLADDLLSIDDIIKEGEK